MAQEVPLLRRLLGTRRRRLIVAAVLAAAAAAGGLSVWLALRGEPAGAELFDLAARFRRAELFAEAAAAYDRVIAADPRGDLAAAAALRAAECRECQGQWRPAEALYERFLRQFPERDEGAAARARLAVLARVRRYADLVAEKDLPPDRCAVALYDMGLLVRDRVSPHAAVAILAAAADRFPKMPQAAEARHAAGTCLLGLGRPVEAREQFARLLANQGGSRLAGEAQFWIGHSYELQGRLVGGFDPDPQLLDRAGDAVAAALRADLDLRRAYDPNAAPAGQPLLPAGLTAEERRSRGEELLRSATEAYRLVVQDHRRSDKAPQALLRVGEIGTRCLKDPDAAVEAYRQLLELYPGTPEAVDRQCGVGGAYVRAGRLAEAERLLKLFLASFPNRPECGDALLNLAECHRGQKEYVKALDDYQGFLARFPDSPRAAEAREEIEWLRKYRL